MEGSGSSNERIMIPGDLHKRDWEETTTRMDGLYRQLLRMELGCSWIMAYIII